MLFLHIIKDEKFIDSAYDLFETAAPSCNYFVLPDTQNTIKHLKKVKPKRVSFFSYLNPFFLRSLRRYDAIFLHSLNQFALELVARADSRVRFIWIGMGCDYYDLVFENPFDKLEIKTAQLVRECIPDYEKKQPAGFIKRNAKKLLYPNLSKKKQIVNKIDYFCPVLKSEFKILECLIPGFSPKLLDWNYGKLSKHLDSLPPPSSDPCFKILVGNSASPNNNHIDAFELIKNARLPKNYEIIVPLSYGEERYREAIIRAGYSAFGDHFRPITDFMPLQDYLDLLASCSATVMNHRRQQAGDNISASLALGHRLFINKKNAFYDEYTRNGAYIYDIKNLESHPDLLKEPLPKHQKEKNRDIVQSLSSWEKKLSKTREVIAITSGSK